MAHTEETKRKQSEIKKRHWAEGIYTNTKTGFQKGHPDYVSPEARKRAAEKAVLKIRGRKFTPEQRVAFQAYWKSKKGKTLTVEHRHKISESHKGEKAYQWKGGLASTNMLIRRSFEMKEWRRKVFQRDDYTCQKCKKRGVKLHAHHDLPFAYYPDLRFEVLNGVTLCIPCHYSIPKNAFQPNHSTKSISDRYPQLAL